ncbi:ankyrin repeat and SOCS box protein 2 [Genypterus blacodes]|uniref:ankyrin repeat and SOCS box protein 2 n=1 Tax=Genypterus blacodes TaxID=154954 RepID=UPI003F75E8A6
MAAARISLPGSAGPGPEFEDYSVYSNLSDDELLQLAIERSLSDGRDATSTIASPAQSSNSCSNVPAQNVNPPAPRHSTHNPPAEETSAHYSSPNPPCPKPPDPKNFDGTISRFITGSGKHMVAYRSRNGNVVHMGPVPKEEEDPLFKAIEHGQVRQVKALIVQPGTNLMLPPKPGWLAIHQATWYGQVACLRLLLAAHPGIINKQAARGESALMIAVSKEHEQCVHVLLEYSADTEIKNNDNETPLYKACERSNAAIVAVLLNHGAAVNTHCIQGWTALQESVSRNNVEIPEMLLKAGAKLSLANIYGITPLFTAAQSGQLAMLRLLLKHGADINSQAADGATALYESTKNGHEETMHFLISQNADANKPGKTGLLPLHVAAQRGTVNMVSMLIPVTTKARVRRTGISPLHLAAERNQDEVLEILIKAGFDVNAQLSDERSKTYEDRRSSVLYFSVMNNNIEAVTMLLESGADPNLDVFNSLLVAARQGCIETITLLVEYGANINASIATHPTTFPAVYMFSMKYLSMFKYLLDSGGNALSCFDCAYGSGIHPPIKTTHSERDDIHDIERSPQQTNQGKGVQFCEMISAPSISRWAGPIIDILINYVGNVTLCSRLMEHLDSYSDWSVIKEKAAPPRPLLQLCRVRIHQLVGHRRVQKLPLPFGLLRFLQHQEGAVDY